LFHPQCFKVLDYYRETDVDKLEKMMMMRIINYIDFLISVVKPKKQLYIAVDGVAPMAKCNQQRQRRYRSVDDNIIKNRIKKKYGMYYNDYWSNTVITPGTKFMEKLHMYLIGYIKKIKKNIDITITYSSYHTPGEGEHKILQDIRNKKKSDNDTYVIYGLDADLIFLSLVSNKKNIYLLREMLHFERTNKKVQNKNHETKKQQVITTDILNDVAEKLNYVSIDSLKTCLNAMFGEYISKRDEEYDLNPDIDFTNDFIFVCYFLGNDFLPHLPSIDIKTGGIDFIIGCYLNTYLKLETHIINLKDGVKINNVFIELFLKEISKSEDYYFRNILPKYKERIYNYTCQSTEPYKMEMWKIEYLRCFKINDPIQLGKDISDLWKWRYYEHYYGITECQQEFIDEMCIDYIKGILWTTYYYFDRCASWTWQYKHSHAPFISDITKYYIKSKIDINSIQYEISKPLTPCSQLLAVLPPSCAHMLPKEYAKLIVDKDSPIIDMYPKKIHLDMINKTQYWKCIPYIPRVNVKRIKKAVKDLKLSKYEKKRNVIRKAYVY
jgi:5'-3' exonuclease